ncbi:MAG TPA: hypothetical protein GXX75_19695 [Clostridiales bacterium]|nr:hypothetical protein [Clostridiales bacterium]
MNNLFLTVFSLSVAGTLLVLCMTLLNKIFGKKYSRRWVHIIWAVIAVRLIIPVNSSMVDIPGITVPDGLAVINSMIPFSKVDDLDRIQQDTSATAEGKAASATDGDNGNASALGTGKDNGNVSASGTGGDNGNASASGAGGDNGNVPASGTGEDNANVQATTQKGMPEEGGIGAEMIFPFLVLDVMAAIWAAGAILFLLYHLGAYLNYRRKISRWGIPVKNAELLERLRDLCMDLGIKRPVNIVVCNQVQSPMLMGFMKPCIVLPPQDFTEEQYYFILKHELIHYKHHDLFYKLLLLGAAALHWFNPFIHYMVYLANNDMELYCDEELIARNNQLYRENYSRMLLQIITGTSSGKNNHLLLSTGFGSRNRQLKNRFFRIMNAKPTKKGTCLTLAFICLIVVAGNLTACLVPSKAGNGEQAGTGIQMNPLVPVSESGKDNIPDKLEKVSSVLVVGIDGVKDEDYLRADSILVVSINPDTKKICLTSFLRDMYLQVPGHGKDKLSSVYGLGGTDLMKNTLETNFGISIDHTVTVNMKAFSDIIDSIGGIEAELTKEEAKYLNRTNYISNKKYRNVTEGRQRLNGNQALGYLRVRKVPTLQGEKEDLGRASRLRSLLTSVIMECSKKDAAELTKVLMKVIPDISTDMDLGQMLIYLDAVLQGGFHTDTSTIPAEGSYTAKVQGGMSILEVDLDENEKLLKQIMSLN